ncbi:family 20 glycosylhydrolase [Gluconobacter oxydans]|uniref:family 20 glycosylhydrolase n=1 Tax=Gluconobacter oxydans TaxID=442 RepID=UPI002648CBEB|nr:family 20 glycosylhydrolase [Gluconobacter oxydans]WKE48736.1 family 20 glycosylhydrolase [Gluconobacter oxydans]
MTHTAPPRGLSSPRRFVRAAWLLLAGSVLAGGLGSVARAEETLLPVPQTVSVSNGVASIGGGIQVVWDTRPSPLLLRAVARFTTRLTAIAGPAGRGAPYVLHLSAGQDRAYLSVDEKERYALTTSATGARLEADGPAGVIHGLATLLQLVRVTSQGALIERVHVEDAPRFAWRGLLMDVSRHFDTVETIERQLDAMELVKLNVLHWHLSDGAGFRVESRMFPKLQTVASHGQYYTQAQIREVVAYAADRGIRVVPEIDVPGHALAILQAYPELAAQPLPDVTAKGLNLNNAALDPTNPQTLRFVRVLYGEMGGLFPDRYVHTGGDEVVSSQWTKNPAIAAYMQAHGFETAAALQAAFTGEVAKIVSAQGHVMMGWDEVSEAPIPKNVVVEPWRASKWTGTATQAGHPVVVSAGYYLDLLRPSEAHYAVDPFDTKAEGITAEQLAKYPPKHPEFSVPFVMDEHAPPLDDGQKALVMGAEGTLWAEMVSEPMLDGRLWPRMAALAERFWSAQDVRDVPDLERRLPLVMAELETTGLQATQHREAMREAMAPGHSEPLKILTEVTVPVRNYALNHLAAPSGDAMLSAPVAVTDPDAFVALRFNAMAARYVRGEHALAAPLRQMLQRWSDNDAAFVTGAKGVPVLEAVVPVSHAVGLLSRAGLGVLDGRDGSAWRMDANRLLQEQQAAFENSVSMLASAHSPQPPGGLLIAILPGLRALLTGVAERAE